MATQGELLTPEGWHSSLWILYESDSVPGNKVILVMSNDWGPSYEDRSKHDSTDVELGYADSARTEGCPSIRRSFNEQGHCGYSERG